MGNRYIIDTLSSVDIQEIVKTGGKVIEIYEGAIYRNNLKIWLFTIVLEKLFALRQKYKGEGNDLMQGSVILKRNRVYGAQIRKDIAEIYECISDHWMQTEYDDNVIDYWRLPNENFIVKFKRDDG